MSKILVIGKYYPPFEGGTEAVTRDVCEMLAKRHEVTAVVYSHTAIEGDDLLNGVRVVRCRPQLIISRQPIALSLIRKINLRNVDLVHFHAPNFFANAVLLFRMLPRNKIPIVITHHMEVHGRRVLRCLVIPLYRILVRYSSAVIVTSAKNAILSADLPANNKTIAIPLGIDETLMRVSQDETDAAMRWKRGLVGEAPVVAFIGRHVRYKGLIQLVQAIAQLDGVHALIGGDGPYRIIAESLSRQIGVADRAHFLGSLPPHDKKNLLLSADVFAFPSTENTEAFGVSLLEAMALGVPAVVSNLPTGVTDMAIDGETAILVPPKNASMLAEGIRRLLADREFATQLGMQARKRIESRFTRSAMLKSTLDVIERALADGSPAFEP